MMTEDEYIVATNRVKVNFAIKAVRDILHGQDGVVLKDEKAKIMAKLYSWESALFRKIEVSN